MLRQPLRQPLAWQPHVHLALFVHRVTGLERGLYFLCATPRRSSRCVPR